MAKVTVGEGTLLQIKISTVYTTIGQRVSISGPSITVNPVPTTHLDSLSKTSRPSRQPDPGQMKLSLFYDPNDTVTHAVLRSRVNKLATIATVPTVDLWQLVYNDGNTTPAMDAFPGYVTQWEENGMEEDGNLGADVTIQLTDTPVFTPGTP